MDKSDIKIIGKEVLHEGYCHVERYILQNRLFSGVWSAPYTREVVRRFNVIAVLPYDPEHNQVVLIEQFRIGALWAKGVNPWLLEVVAGVADKEEDFEELIHRETKEEAGLDVIDFLLICRYLSSPGGSSEEVGLFCAKINAAKAPQFAGVKAENEDIKVHILDVYDAFNLVVKGVINNASTIIALQWLELNLTKVRNRWGLNA